MVDCVRTAASRRRSVTTGLCFNSHPQPCRRAHTTPSLAIPWRLSLVAMLFLLSAGRPAFAQALSHSQGPNLGTSIAGTVEYQLFAAGGNGPGTYLWSVVSGALPPGVFGAWDRRATTRAPISTATGR